MCTDTCFNVLVQAFQETIEIFQQKNESFKNALKEVEEVSASVAPQFFPLQPIPSLHSLTLRTYIYLPTERRAGEACPPMDPRQ